MSTFPTTTALENYYFFRCETSCSYSTIFYSNAFKITVLSCVYPSIIAANVKSTYTFYVQSAFSQVQVLPSNYLDSTG